MSEVSEDMAKLKQNVSPEHVQNTKVVKKKLQNKHQIWNWLYVTEAEPIWRARSYLSREDVCI